MDKQLTVMIVAGEASGDLHGARLISELKQLAPDLRINGMGGSCMQAAGAELVVNSSHISVCGFLEVIRYLPSIITIFRKIKKILLVEPPDLLILIDYPTFNLKLAGVAQRRGIKVLYYISPQIWAWHTSRIKKIKQVVNMMAVIFPFEKDFYREHLVNAKYVGHPLVGSVKTTPGYKHLAKGSSKITIGLLPGSRQNEILYILPTLIDTANLLQETLQQPLQFLLPLANTISENEIKPHLSSAKMPITIVRENRYDAMSCCDAAIAASGTVTLELALLKVPLVIVYKSSRLSFAIAKRLVRIPHIGLCNIVAEKKIVTELLQQQANPQNIAGEVIRLLTDTVYRQEQLRQLAMVSEKLHSEKECSIGQLAYEILLETVEGE